MKRLLIALALSVAPIVPLASCASFEQVAPKSVRAVYADAEVAVVGALNVAVALYQSGIISRDEFVVVFAKLENIAAGLNRAYALIRAGETISAGPTVAELSDALSAIALELSVRAEQAPPPAPPPQPVPTQSRPVVI